MKRFLGLSSEEIAENQKLWQEENIDADVGLSASAELRGQGITANGIGGDISGLSTATEPELGDETTGMPGETPPTQVGGSTPPTSPPA